MRQWRQRQGHLPERAPGRGRAARSAPGRLPGPRCGLSRCAQLSWGPTRRRLGPLGTILPSGATCTSLLRANICPGALHSARPGALLRHWDTRWCAQRTPSGRSGEPHLCHTSRARWPASPPSSLRAYCPGWARRRGAPRRRGHPARRCAPWLAGWRFRFLGEQAWPAGGSPSWGGSPTWGANLAGARRDTGGARGRPRPGRCAPQGCAGGPQQAVARATPP